MCITFFEPCLQCNLMPQARLISRTRHLKKNSNMEWKSPCGTLSRAPYTVVIVMEYLLLECSLVMLCFLPSTTDISMSLIKMSFKLYVVFSFVHIIRCFFYGASGTAPNTIHLYIGTWAMLYIFIWCWLARGCCVFFCAPLLVGYGPSPARLCGRHDDPHLTPCGNCCPGNMNT